MAEKIGVLNLGETSENFAGRSRSNDHAKSFRLAPTSPMVAVNHPPAAIAMNTMAIASGFDSSGAASSRKIVNEEAGMGLLPALARYDAATLKFTPYVLNATEPMIRKRAIVTTSATTSE